MKTFLELKEINGLFNELSKKDPDLYKTKFGYSIDKFIKKNIVKPFGEYRTELSDIWVKYAMTDKDGKLVMDRESETGFGHTKPDWNKMIAEIRVLEETWDKKEFEVEPCISSQVPELTEYQKEILQGLLIP